MQIEQTQEEAYNSIAEDIAEAQAKSRGCYCLHATDDTLQLDIDTPDQYKQFLAMHQRLASQEDGALVHDKYLELPSSKRGNRHILLALTKPLSIPERIALQLALGSDPMREYLSLLRYTRGQANPVLLFRPEGEAPPRVPRPQASPVAAAMQELFDDFPNLDEEDDLPF